MAGAGEPEEGGCGKGRGTPVPFPGSWCRLSGKGVPEAGVAAWVTVTDLRLVLPPRGF